MINKSRLIMLSLGFVVISSAMNLSSKDSAEKITFENSQRILTEQIKKQTQELTEKKTNQSIKYEAIESFEAKFKRFAKLDPFLIEDLIHETAEEIQKSKLIASANQNSNSLEDHQKLKDLFRTHDALYKVQLERMLQKM